MTKRFKNLVLGSLFGLGLAVIVTACVKNDNKDGVVGEVGEKTISPIVALQVSENGVSVKNQVDYNGPVYQIIEKGWSFTSEKDASIKISIEEDMEMENCRVAGEPNAIGFQLRVNNQAPGVVMNLGQSYDVPAGKHMIVLTINNTRLCPTIRMAFLAQITRNLVDTNVAAQKLHCQVAGRPNRLAIINTRPFEFSILNRRGNSDQHNYIIAQNVENASPDTKIFCSDTLQLASCETSDFAPKQAINILAGYNTVCTGSDKNQKRTTSRPAQLTLHKRSRGHRELIDGTFSCMTPSSKKTLIRRLENCKVDYDHGKAIVHKVNQLNNFSASYSCVDLKVNFDLTLEQMKTLPEVIYWNVYDMQNDQYVLRNWVRADRRARGNNLEELELVVRKVRNDRNGFRSNILRRYLSQDLAEILPNLRIVLRDSDDAFQANKGLGHINLGELKDNSPASFVDISNQRRRCR